MSRALTFVSLLALAAPARVAGAESAIPAPVYFPVSPAQKAYWGAGYVRAPMLFDVISISGDGYTATAGGAGVGLHVGITKKWYLDASVGFQLGGGNVDRPTGSERANYFGWHLSSTFGRKLYIDERVFVVAYSGLGRSSGFLEFSGTNGDDARMFSVKTHASAIPLGVFATFGKDATKVHVTPSLAIGYVFTGRLDSRLGPEPAAGSGESLDPFVTYSAGLDVGYAPGGQYLGVLWHHAPKVGDNSATDTVVFRFTWALKANKLR